MRTTRLRITKAAYTLFCERGFSGTTMADVAQAAGVAVQTDYFVFHTKGELLSRTYDFAVLGEGEVTFPRLLAAMGGPAGPIAKLAASPSATGTFSRCCHSSMRWPAPWRWRPSA